MRIALDYDGTYTNDPELWEQFIANARARGHEVVCVTMRRPAEALTMGIDVYYTARRAKKLFMMELGVLVDVWIDDMPEFLLTSAA